MMRTMTQAKRVQDAVKRAGKRRQSVSIAESFRERDLRRDPCHLDAILCRNTIHPGRYVILERSRGSNGDVTVAKISHGEQMIS